MTQQVKVMYHICDGLGTNFLECEDVHQYLPLQTRVHDENLSKADNEQYRLVLYCFSSHNTCLLRLTGQSGQQRHVGS